MKKFNTHNCKSAALILFFAISVSSLSVHAQCNAYFQSNYNSTTDEVDFTQVCTFDTSIHPLIYMWDFGDGTTAVEENPSHHYSSGNNYVVCLILYVGNGAGCCQDTFCEQIDVIPASIRKNNDWISGVSIYASNKNVALHLTLEQSKFLTLNLVTITGLVIPVHVSQNILKGRNEIDFSMPDYPPGIYLLRVEDEKGNFVAKRFMLY